MFSQGVYYGVKSMQVAGLEGGFRGSWGILWGVLGVILGVFFSPDIGIRKSRCSSNVSRF